MHSRAHAGAATAALVVILLAGCVEGLPDLDVPRAPAAPRPAPAEGGLLQLHVIDVGQGDSILLVTPSGATLLMDAGDRSKGDEVIAYLRAHGIVSLDVFVASHGDADHIGGVGTESNNVLDAFPPRRVYEPGYPKTTLTYETFLERVEASGAQYFDHRDFGPGDRLPLDANVTITFLHPAGVDERGEPNDEAIVLRVEYGAFSAILPGDLGSRAERVVLSRGFDLRSTVLKVGHHGSRGSSSLEWLEAVQPQVAVVSVGASNPYGHPHPEAMERVDAFSRELYRTDEDGSILITTDGATWSVRTHA